MALLKTRPFARLIILPLIIAASILILRAHESAVGVPGLAFGRSASGNHFTSGDAELIHPWLKSAQESKNDFRFPPFSNAEMSCE
jgi:hypothetical protein